MGEFVIAVYKPKEGREQELAEIVRRHVPILRAEGLVTDRPAYAMRSSSGAVVEVFEWLSKEAIDRAHTNPAVAKLWEEFGAVSDYGTLAELPEANQMFAGFEPIE
jgi:hypothetical protein